MSRERHNSTVIHVLTHRYNGISKKWGKYKKLGVISWLEIWVMPKFSVNGMVLNLYKSRNNKSDYNSNNTNNIINSLFNIENCICPTHGSPFLWESCSVSFFCALCLCKVDWQVQLPQWLTFGCASLMGLLSHQLLQNTHWYTISKNYFLFLFNYINIDGN